MRIRTPLDLGLLLRGQRRRLGLNQAELAARAGVSRQWIVAVEQGKSRAELGLVLRTLAALDLSLAVAAGERATRNKVDRDAAIDLDAVIDAARRPRR